MSLKLIAEVARLKAEVASLREEVAQANQKPHMLAELVTKFDKLEAVVAALEAEAKVKPYRKRTDG
jgi:hypothetical protein